MTDSQPAVVARLRGSRNSGERVDKFADRRAELGEAALTTLATLGYARTSLREIAQNSEFSHGVLHYYFRDNYRADSGLIAAVHVLEQLCAGTDPMSVLRRPFERYADSGEINTQVADLIDNMLALSLDTTFSAPAAPEQAPLDAGLFPPPAQ